MSSNNDLKKEFGILQVLECHKQDVRTVSGYPNGGVLTGSRDQIAKLYLPDNPKDRQSELKEVQKFESSINFVSSCCQGKNKSGEIEIYIGSHDMNIYKYSMGEDGKFQLKETLMRHSGPVSALAFRVCNEKDVLVSGSWDATTILWRDGLAEVTLYGHINAVWSVAFVARSFVLTGGADKTIRKWDLTDGRLLNIFEGHTDCVRGLAVINGQSFLSCSNDASVILWSMDGNMLQTFTGHDNFIFDICIVREPLKPEVEPPKNRPYCFVTVSEDKTVRVWGRESGCLQVIPLQATTLWSVAALDNGNFVVGTSTGHAYLFSEVTPGLQSSSGAETVASSSSDPL